MDERKQIVITRIDDRIVSAYMIGETVFDLLISDDRDDALHVGDVFVGRVKNVVDNILAAFVEVQPGVMGYLKLEKEQLKTVKAEQELIVQVIKTAKGTKDAVLSMNVELVGRYAVLQEREKGGVRVSRKIRDEETIERLMSLGEQAVDDYPENTRDSLLITVRTNAAEAVETDIQDEIKNLLDSGLEIRRHGLQRTVFSRLYREPPVYVRMINRYRAESLDRVITDIDDVMLNLGELSSDVSVERYEDASYSLEARYAIRSTLEKALMRRVWLKSGANLIIDRTEAMTVIDVNSAKAIEGKRASESTFFKINMEAAGEIARQLRLRNLSGIILIDFIDMKEKEHVDALIRKLRELLSADPVRTVFVDITKLGIVEITRTKRFPELYDMLSDEKNAKE